MKTLRRSIVDAINELNKLLSLTKDEEQKQAIYKLKRILYTLLDEVIKQDLSNNTPLFQDALESLKEATEVSKKAIKDLEKVVDAINKTALAAKAVDKVVNLGIGLLT